MADLPESPEPAVEPEVDELADESEADSLLCDSGSAAGDSEVSWSPPAEAPTAKGQGRGRGAGRG